MKSATTSTLLPLLTPSSSLTLFSHPRPFTFPIPPLSPHLRRRPITATRYGRWDSSSGGGDGDDDDFGRKRKRRRRRPWWSDGSPAEMEQGPGIVEEFIDSVWIFKVFGSYGWMLPAIIISMLLATGPKAFLLALALPVGQSAFTLAFKKLWGREQEKRKRKNKTKMKAGVNTASNFEFEDEEEDEGESQGSRNGNVGYQSWVARDDFSDNTGSQNFPTFGGWDDLDRMKDFDMGPLTRSDRRGRTGRKHAEKIKFSRRERKSEMPLLLRLLIAVFPFLGSWTNML